MAPRLLKAAFFTITICIISAKEANAWFWQDLSDQLISSESCSIAAGKFENIDGNLVAYNKQHIATLVKIGADHVKLVDYTSSNAFKILKGLALKVEKRDGKIVAVAPNRAAVIRCE